MPIQILPARLANQIAAGEVVERPASVVKELIENSLDAGASRIEIDIEAGGAKCIRIKDNGKGVSKDQLTLALSRHATSKISHLDDLEAIVSLGFRGEALASVSSVSRLTFTSKPADQEQAWQAIAEGRDMQVEIQPVAHPQGTTVEVLDLFFNTPARRRFLKTEKTEFQHIDELIRRIALSRFEIAFVLKHNGKIVRQYRPAETQNQQEKRLASICSESFVKGSLYFQNDDNNLKISGWIADAESTRGLNDVQYCYINGRMIRDKLINHAIKQAYADFLVPGKFPAYVIYISCPAEQVDVNVHPAKHEVRFHQARWVHDFIVAVLNSTLNENSLAVGLEVIADETASKHDYASYPNQTSAQANESQPNDYYPSSNRSPLQASASTRSSYSGQQRYNNPAINESEVNAYCDFVAQAQPSVTLPKAENKNSLGQVIALIEESHLLIKIEKGHFLSDQADAMFVFSLHEVDRVVKQKELFDAWCNGEIISQPLLLPVRIVLDPLLLVLSDTFSELFIRLGFIYKKQDNKLIISKVPTLLRHAPIAKILPDLLSYLADFDNNISDSEVDVFCNILVKTVDLYALKTTPWDLQSGLSLLETLFRAFPEQWIIEQSTQGKLFYQADLSLLLQGKK